MSYQLSVAVTTMIMAMSAMVAMVVGVRVVRMRMTSSQSSVGLKLLDAS